MKNLCDARPNSGTCEGMRAWNAPARRHTPAPTCVHASPSRRSTTAGHQSLCMTSACVGLVHTPRSRLGWRSRAQRGEYAHAGAIPSPPLTHSETTAVPCINVPERLTAKQGRLCAHSAINSCPLSSRVWARRPPPAIAATAGEHPLRSLSSPAKTSKLLSTPHSSSHHRLFPCIAHTLAGTRAAAGALPQPRRHRSPEPPPATPPPLIDLWWVQSEHGIICLPGPATLPASLPHRQGHGCESPRAYV
jgi:hypothetical protein